MNDDLPITNSHGMAFVIRASSFLRASSFVIRHSNHGREFADLKPEVRKLWLEARELHLSFAKIWRSGKQ